MPHRLILQEAEGQVQVLSQPAGQLVPEPAGPPRPFAAPLSEAEREDLRWYLEEDYLLAPYAVYEERGAAIQARLAVWGERLFTAVFESGPGRGAYLRAGPLAQCELWISSSSPAFLGLPWELLRDPARPSPLALDLAGLNRTLSAASTAVESRPGHRLRVLMVIARPGGREDVRYRMIARPLLKRLEPVAGQVDLEVLRPPTFDRLRSRLDEAAGEGEPYQILHSTAMALLEPKLRPVAASLSASPPRRGAISCSRPKPAARIRSPPRTLRPTSNAPACRSWSSMPAGRERSPPAADSGPRSRRRRSLPPGRVATGHRS